MEKVSGVKSAQVLEMTTFEMEKVEARLIPDGSSYYVTVHTQRSAEEGERKMKVDRLLANKIADALESGGVISLEEMTTEILPAITDSAVYGEGEKNLVRLLYSALDGRKSVKINGRTVKMTGAAKNAFRAGMSSFFGKLGARERNSPLHDGYDRVKPNKFI